MSKHTAPTGWGKQKGRWGMKKLRNKRLILAVALVLVLALAVGVTYAWFTASSTAAPVDLDFGRLGIEGAFEADTEDMKYQPGDTVEMEGTVKNTGNLALMAKVTLNSSTTFVRNEKGELLPNGETIVKENDPNVTALIDGSSLKSEIKPDGSVIVWFKHKTNPNEYYVVLEPGLESGLDLEAAFSGSGMGNQYMDAVVTYVTGWDATQTKDGAIWDLWGVSRDTQNGNLEMIPIVVRGRSLGTDPNAQLLARLDELFA